MPTEGEYWTEDEGDEPDGCSPPAAPETVSTGSVVYEGTIEDYVAANKLPDETVTILSGELCGKCTICPYPPTCNCYVGNLCLSVSPGGSMPSVYSMQAYDTTIPANPYPGPPFSGTVAYWLGGVTLACAYVVEGYTGGVTWKLWCELVDDVPTFYLQVRITDGHIPETTLLDITTEIQKEDIVCRDGTFRAVVKFTPTGQINDPPCFPNDVEQTVVICRQLPDDGTCSLGCDDPPELIETNPWWIQKDKTIVQQLDPPIDWLGGPHPTEAIALYWKDQIGPKAFCVQWHDHQAGEYPVDEDPAVPTLISDMPTTVGAFYVECLTETQITELTASATLVKVAYPIGKFDGLDVFEYFWEYWGCPPRRPIGTYKDEPDPGDNPDAPVRPVIEDPPRLRKMRISVGGDFTGTTLASTSLVLAGGWYTEVEEFVTDDACPLETYTPGQPNLCIDGVTPRFTFPVDGITGLPVPLPWYGFSERRSNIEKCRENCPPCHRPRYCRIPDGEGGFVIVEEPEDKGTDWNYDLPASDQMLVDMYFSLALCSWLCSDPCFKNRFPMFCDPDNPGYIGCAERGGGFSTPVPEAVRAAMREVRKATPVSIETVRPKLVTGRTPLAQLKWRPCEHAGTKVAGEPCGSTLRNCTKHAGVVCSGMKTCGEANRNHDTCGDYAPTAPKGGKPGGPV